MNIFRISQGIFCLGITWASFIFFIASLSAKACNAQHMVTSPPPIATGWIAKTIAEGINHPWGLCWLPSGELLVTSRSGSLHMLKDGKLISIPMEGLPTLLVEGQGGLFDISIHPKASGTGKITLYLTAATGTLDANRTTLLRGSFDGKQVSRLETLFRAQPDKSGAEHFGSRLTWLPDNTLLMSIGDGGNPPRKIAGMLAREQAQNLGSHLGSIVRLDEHGKAPTSGQPFAGRGDAKPEIWSYGHRNIQGLIFDPLTKQVWASEHGPLGGDELNRVEAGKNFGWPLASFGRDYRTSQPIGTRSLPAMVDPQVVWLPTSVAPSGLTVYTGSRFPNWKGSIFSGTLVSQDVRRIILNKSGEAMSQERIPIGKRVRDVRMGPDEHLYVLTDSAKGEIIRIEPK
jgi:aldose sugar dehydrogenase